MRKGILLLLSIILMGCTSNTLEYRYEHTNSSGWSRSDTIRFDIPKVNKTADYRMSIGLRTTNSFPYEGLYIVVETRLRHPYQVMRDTINYSTTDKKGNPNGSGINLQQYERPVANLTLRKGQYGKVYIYHIMSREEIPGVRDVGLMLESISTRVDSQEDK